MCSNPGHVLIGIQLGLSVQCLRRIQAVIESDEALAVNPADRGSSGPGPGLRFPKDGIRLAMTL